MTENTTTKDTAEAVSVPSLPVDDRSRDGYDWMEALTGTAWVVLPNWGSEGWDAGSWPYIILAVARSKDDAGELFGYGQYLEGDTETHWIRSQTACHEAITESVFGFWKSGQADGPEDLPVAAVELPSRYRKPFFGWTQGRDTAE